MKKIIALVIAIVMMAAISVPAFAAELNETGEASKDGIEVSYEVSVAWSVSIPDSVSVGVNKTGTAAVSATGCYLPNAQSLKVNVTSTNGFKLIHTENDQKSYTYTINSATSGTVKVLEVLAGAANGEGSATINFAVTGEETYVSGTYKDTLTFAVVVDAVA